MARYLLFSGGDCEIGGGMDDFVKGFDNKAELMKFLTEEPEKYRNDWWHVADAVNCRIMLYDYEFKEEHRFIRCGDCGDVLKIVPKDKEAEPGEDTILCEKCQIFKERYGSVGT